MKNDTAPKPAAHTPRRGRMAEIEQERIEAEVVAGERRYYESIMHDEISNDPEVFEEESNG
jgi:hypothetical protein